MMYDKEKRIVILTSDDGNFNMGVPMKLLYKANKVIDLRSKRFVYLKNRSGPLGEAIPTEEEITEIKDILICGEYIKSVTISLDRVYKDHIKEEPNYYTRLSSSGL